MWFDLSEHQGPIDFSKVSKIPGLEGCIIRVQSGYTHPDTMYKTYVAGCKANGIPYGTYAYGQFVSVNDAISEADSAFNLMDKDSQFFALDVEVNKCKVPSDLVLASQAFIDRLHSKGLQKVGLYSGEYFYTANLKAVRADFLWLANYGVNDGQPHNQPVCDLWQYTSNYHADGIPQNTVDVSKLTGTKQADYFTGTPKNIFFLTGGFFSGDDLCKVFQYITERHWWYEPSRRDDGSLLFKVGGLPQGRTAAIDFENFLKSNGYWYQIQ
jgi:N-acetylmuramoyl-L-alanine amidase